MARNATKAPKRYVLETQVYFIVYIISILQTYKDTRRGKGRPKTTPIEL